jgi:flavin-dependent dehydrogenase
MIEAPRVAEVAVIGGGPAGAVSALLLARLGISTLLLEASNELALRIGETLPPVANRLLRDLGLWNVFCQQNHRASEGIVSAWTNGRPEVNDFFLSTQGTGWNLDRKRFDAMLLQECKNAGALVCRSSKLLTCSRTADQRWLLEFDRQGRKYQASTRYLVDATGKLTAGALRCLSGRFVVDRLIGVAKFYSTAESSAYTIVEAVDEGWFYSSTLPQGRVVIMYFTDADIYSARRKSDPDYWSKQLKKARCTRDRLQQATVPRESTIVSAATTCRVQFSGDGWVTVGDGAQSFDPLSSLGIYKALDSARCAFEFLLASSNRNRGARDYSNWSGQVFRSYLRQRTNHYRRQERWSGSAFWERRRTA